MFTKSLKSLALVLIFTCGTTTFGQWQGGYPPEIRYKPVPPWPAELGFSYHHASTVIEGMLRGQAALTHAAGSYWLSVSQAMICREYARSLALQNRRQRIDFKVANRARIEASRKHSCEAKRIANEAIRGAKYQAAYQLTLDEFDPTTGEITWPEFLLAVEYAEIRSSLDELCREQAGSKNGTDLTAEIARSVESLKRALRRKLRTVNPADYLNAQKFLLGIMYETEYGSLGAKANGSHIAGIAAQTDCHL